MRISFVYSCDTFDQEIGLNCLKDAFTEMGHYTVSYKNVKRKSERINLVESDLVLCYNRHAFEWVNQRYIEGVPIIFIVCSSDIVKEYIQGWRKVTLILILQNDILKDICYPKEMVLLIKNLKKQRIINYSPLKFEKTQLRRVMFVDENQEIHQNCYFSLLKVINEIPSLFSIQPVILSRVPIHKDFVNPEVHVIIYKTFAEQLDVFHKYLDTCEVVIGNGSILELAIERKKYCLVLGNFGYGGVLSVKNIALQRTINYKGRLGGELGEFFPYLLVLDDLKKIFLEMNKDRRGVDKSRLKKMVTDLHKKELKKFGQALHRVALGKQQEDESVKYVVSENLAMYEMDKNEWCIFDKQTHKYLYHVGENERKVLDFFNTPQKISLIFEKFSNDFEEQELEAFLSQIKLEKILVKEDAN